MTGEFDMNPTAIGNGLQTELHFTDRTATGATKAASATAQTPAMRTAEPEAKPSARTSATDDVKLRARLAQALEDLNRHLRESGRAIGFSIDRDTEQLVVTVTNRATGELVRRIPLDAFAHVAEHADQLKGLLLDELR